MKVLLTGATGYVGGRLLKKLEAEGHLVRCLARNEIWPIHQLVFAGMLRGIARQAHR